MPRCQEGLPACLYIYNIYIEHLASQFPQHGVLNMTSHLNKVNVLLREKRDKKISPCCSTTLERHRHVVINKTYTLHPVSSVYHPASDEEISEGSVTSVVPRLSVEL